MGGAEDESKRVAPARARPHKSDDQRGDQMPKLSLSQACDETRAVLARDGRLFISVALALIVFPQTVVGLAAPHSELQASTIGVALMLVVIVIGLAAQIALNRLAIGPSTTVGAAINRGFVRVPALIGSLVILSILIFVLLIPVVLLLVVLGFAPASRTGHEASAGVVFAIVVATAFTYAIFQLVIPVAAAEQGGSLHLISRSWRLARGSYWRLFAFAMLLIIGLSIVLLAGQYGLGSLIALALGPADPLSFSALAISLVVSLMQAAMTIVFAVMLARLYVQLAGASAQPGVPRSGI